MEIALSMSVLAFLAVFLVFYGMHRIVSSSSQAIGSRLDQYASRSGRPTETTASWTEQPSVVRGLNRMITGSASSQLATELARADLKLTPSEFIIANFAAVLIGFLIALVLGRSSLIFALLGGIAGFYLPRFYVRRRQSQRLNAFNNQLGDTLILLANSLRSGYSLLQAMETVSKEVPPPMSTEFGRVVREIGLGLTVEEALAHLVQRINSEDLDMVVTAVNIQHEVGGNLAEILDTISHTIRERVRIKGQIRALTASQRLSGNVVALLPFALAGFMFMFNPGYLSKMWEEACGLMMLGTGLCTIVMGYFIIQKITQIEV
jgi:tight adherence protein B